MRLDEYAEHDAVGLAELVRRGEVSPVELTELALAGIEAVNLQLNALVEVYDDAIERARAAGGRSSPTGAQVAALSGVPMVRKDIGAPEAGTRTELGSRLAAGLVTHRDSYLTRGFKDAGLVIIGRSTTPEFGCYAATESAATGVTANPWSPNHTAGGSSGGSAALVAAGVVPVGHANDGAGSIRIPASCCGLVGLKPSRGRVSAGPGAGEPNFGGSVQLVVSRTVRDTAAVLDAAGGPRPGDPFVIAQPVESFSALASRPPERPLRIGFTTADWGPSPIDPEVAGAVRSAAAALAMLGHHVEEAAFPFDYGRFEPTFVDLWAIGAAGPILAIAERMQRPLTEEFLEPVTLSWVERCRRLSGLDVTHALDEANRLTRRAGVFFGEFDVLLTPTLAQQPPVHGVLGGQRTDLDALGNARVLLGFNPYCPLFNITGQPAVSLPVAQSSLGLPIGAQLVARHAEEGVLLQLGRQLEAALPWADRRPPVHVAPVPLSRF